MSTYHSLFLFNKKADGEGSLSEEANPQSYTRYIRFFKQKKK